MQLQKYGQLSASGDGPSTAKLNLATRVRYALDAAKGMVFLHEHQVILPYPVTERLQSLWVLLP